MNCKICGRFFKPKVWNQVYCTQECYSVSVTIRNRSKPKKEYEKTCVHCGVEFISKRKDSKSCGKGDKLHRPNEKYNTVNVNCATCGKEKQVRVGDYNRNKRENRPHYCSRICSSLGTGRTIELVCAQCNKSFTRGMSEYNNYNKDGKYVFCSRDCQDANIDYILRGKYHYCYVDGKSVNNRGKGWKKIRKTVRRRDNFTCQECGITQDELGKELDVHHIIPYREFESSEDANKLDNLISLCPSCHHKAENRIFKNGTEA